MFFSWSVIAALDVASRSEAAEWSLLPSLGVKGVYNSNLLLTPFPHDETYGYWVSPAAEVAGKTERLEVSSRIAADVVGYFGGEDRQFTNVFTPLSVRYKTEKDLLGFTGGFTRDNTLLSELQATGVVLQFAQRNQWTANPTWARQLTEKLSVQSGVQFSDTTYESSRLVDYRVVGGSGGLLYQLTERDQIQLMGSYVHFRTTDSAIWISSRFSRNQYESDACLLMNRSQEPSMVAPDFYRPPHILRLVTSRLVIPSGWQARV